MDVILPRPLPGRRAAGSPPGELVTGEPLPPSVAWGLLLVLVAAFALRLAFAAAEPGPGRFWDERYSLMNVRAVLGEGGTWPAKAFYPSLSYLPQTVTLGAVYAACDDAGWCRARVFDDDGDFTPLAYRLCRLLVAVFGTLGVFWTFRIGALLFGPQTGLLAAALLAAVPAHLRMSAIFKPDALMVWLVLLALEATLWTSRRPSLARYLVAGAAAGLAASAKYNGAAAAVPLLVTTLLGARRQPRRLGWLVWAGIAAAAVFLVLDPHVFTATDIFVRDNWTTVREYGWRGEAAGTGRAGALLAAASALLSPSFHGRLAGGLGFAGLAGLAAVVAWPSRLAPLRREQLAALLAAPLGYLTLYLALTTNPNDHSWIPLTPFVALGAAWLAVAVWTPLAARLPRRSAGAVATMLASAVCVWVLAGAATFVYHGTVPSTSERATALLRRELPRRLEHRLVVADTAAGAGLRVKRSAGNKAGVLSWDELGADAPRVAAGADAVVLSGGGEPAAANAVPSRAAGRWSIGGRPFHAWGPPLRVAVHPWRRNGPPLTLERQGTGYAVPASELPAAGRVGFEIVVPIAVPARRLLPVRLDGRALRAATVVVGRGGRRLLTERVTPRADGLPSRLRLGSGSAAAVVRMLRWLPPEDGPPARHRAEDPL